MSQIDSETPSYDRTRPRLGQHPSYLDGREKLLARLEALPLSVWPRTGRHEDFGVVTLRQQVSYFAAHESMHMHQIQALIT